jgi:geranylgeranyl diphosphate synthase type II
MKVVKNVAGEASFIEFLKKQKQVIDAHLDKFLPAETTYPETVHQAMRYSLFAGGKRIRPVLSLATNEALEGRFERAIHLACALEMIHTYSLIHDDLPAMDDDDFRRGQLTCHKKFGEGIAILAGNGLLTHAFRVLSEMPAAGDSRIHVVNQICQAIGTEHGVIAGQVVDLTTQGKPFSSEQLEYIHVSKTAALIETAVHCAALLAEADDKTVNQLRVYGQSVGLAFQIVDDILDEVGSSAELGKTLGKDRIEQKATYPALHGIVESRRIVDELVDKATSALAFLGSKGAVLEELARFVSVRRF